MQLDDSLYHQGNTGRSRDLGRDEGGENDECTLGHVEREVPIKYL